MTNIFDKKRILFLDLLKFISLFVIVSYHFIADVFIVHNMNDLSLIYSFYDRKNVNIIMVSVALFILISGASLCIKSNKTLINNYYSIKDLFDFYKNRLIRLLIPFYIAYIIYFIIKIINVKSIHIFNTIVPKYNFIYTILGIDEYFNASNIKTFSLGIGEWFLGCIIFCYIVFPLLYNANKKNKYITFVIMTIYYIIISNFLNKFYMPAHMNFFNQIYNFYLGIFLIDEKLLSKINKIHLSLMIIFLIFIYLYNKVLPINYIFISSITATFLFLVFYKLENYITNEHFIRFLNLFSKYSYEIFLSHHFVIYQVDYILNYRQINNKTTLLIFIIDIILTVLFAYTINLISKFIINLIGAINDYWHYRKNL